MSINCNYNYQILYLKKKIKWNKYHILLKISVQYTLSTSYIIEY